MTVFGARDKFTVSPKGDFGGKETGSRFWLAFKPTVWNLFPVRQDRLLGDASGLPGDSIFDKLVVKVDGIFAERSAGNAAEAAFSVDAFRRCLFLESEKD